ncbi:phage tail tape measure protein [Desulforegula conservatrix]|uniref:phage tail tape measure protein n=1 Tax=Desulforegula conservatrix TaxID=153026 RepID=UPI0004021E85|nr:phage tail tape measure protein [Desulforegula conservatrix]
MDGIYSVQAVMSLVDNITGPLRKVKNELGETGQAALSLSGRMSKLAEKMLPLAVAAGILLGSLVPCVSAAADLESAISGVGAITNASASEMAALKQSALDLGASTVFSAGEVAAAEKSLGMAGFTVKENIAALPGVLDLAAASQMDLGRTAGIASSVLRSFHLEASRSGEVADILTSTFTSSNTTLESLSSTMANAAPVAAAAGASIADVAAMAGQLGNVGIDASVAGTGIKIMFQRLQAPAGQAADTLQKLGLKTKDAAGNMLPIYNILSSLEAKTKTMGTADRAEVFKKIFGEEAISSVTALMSVGVNKVKTYAQTLAQPGKAASVASKNLDNFKGAVEMLSGAWDGLKITIGDIFLPVLRILVEWLGKVVDVLNSLASSSVGKTLIFIAGVAATAGAAFVSFHAVSALLAAALPWITSALTSLGAVIAGLSWPVLILIAAVAALTLAWKSNFGGMADKISSWWTKVTLVFSGVQAVFASLKNGTGEIRGQLAKDIQANGLVGVVTTVSKVIYRIQEAFGGFVSAFKSVTSGLMDSLLPVWTEISSALAPVIDLIKEVVSSVMGGMSGTNVSGWKLFGQVVGVIAGSGLQLLVEVLKVLIIPLKMVFQIVGALADGFRWLGKAIGESAGWIYVTVAAIPGVVSGFVDSVVGYFTSLSDRVMNALMNLAPVQWIKSAIEMGGSLMDAGKNLLTTFIDGALLTLTTSIETIKATIQNLFSGLNLFESGAKLISTFTEGIRSALSVPAQLVESGLQKIRNLLPFSDAKEGPLSTLTLSGARMMETLGTGVRQAAPDLQATVASSLALKMPEPGSGVPAPALPEIVLGDSAKNVKSTNEAGKSRKIEVHIRSLVLPEVKDSDGFVTALKGMVEAHGW